MKRVRLARRSCEWTSTLLDVWFDGGGAALGAHDIAENTGGSWHIPANAAAAAAADMSVGNSGAGIIPPGGAATVSYTHLTLPTNREV